MNIGMEQIHLQPAIRGKIADLMDYPVASARVVISGSKLAEKRITQTGSEGYFMFSRIPPGIYTLEVNYTGFSKLVQRGIAVRERAITGVDLKMDIQEDSRSLRLQAFSLEYVNDQPDAGAAEAPSHLTRQLHDVTAAMHLDRALFNPPAALRTGRPVIIEFGVYQNLKEEIMRSLLERKIGLFDGGQIEVMLNADLQAAGCLILPKSLPQMVINGARYVEWQWQVLPQIAGLGLIRLSLEARVDFGGHGERKKCLLVMDREVKIKRNRWLELRRFIKMN